MEIQIDYKYESLFVTGFYIPVNNDYQNIP